mgnify:CR=1 FL=1
MVLSLHLQKINDNNICLAFSTVVDNRYLEIQRDGTTTEWSVRDIPGEPITIAHVWSEESLDSIPNDCCKDQQNTVENKALIELKHVFDSHLAHQCYYTFLRHLGDTTMENTLKNKNVIKDLCHQHEQELSFNTYSKS